MSRSARSQRLLIAHLAGIPGSTEKLVTALRPVILKRILTTFKRRRAADHHRSPEIIEELIQEVFLSLFRNKSSALRAFEPGGCLTFVRYVSRIAGRQTNNYLNTLWSQKRGGRYGCLNFEPWSEDVLETPADTYTPESQVAARQAANRLGALLFPTLSHRGQLAFRAIFIDGRPLEELTVLLGGKTCYVHNWRHRIRREAERVASQEGFFDPGSQQRLQLAA